ncbi:flagellin [Jannaschia pohangensis]|uniref:Flagellar hook-associated protein 3 FlgL n=1 Tax=Jannaschia pohangensis TaxID=390807 RepID=A0A1I3JV16_9RHOB|nr:flagellin [Jannaschia pohangensis]SFI64092.1 flagellar hook-associated protein 3 FlgL [Jannaschia pohangensis]
MQTKSPLLPFIGPRDYSVETRARIETLTSELASGKKSDVGRAVASDFSALSRIMHQLQTYDAQRGALSVATTWLEGAQAGLAQIQSVGAAISEKLPAALTGTDPGAIATLARDGEAALRDIVSTLSQDRAGRLVFANGDVAAAPPIDFDTLLAETAALAAAATDPNDLVASFDSYFAIGGGAEVTALRNFPASSVSFPIGDGEAAEIPVSLADPGVRAALKQAAMIASLPSAGFAIEGAARQSLAVVLPSKSAVAATALVETQARLGSVEERFDRIVTTLDETRTRLEGQRTDLLSADPFETATRLQDEMTRLETIFAVTARRARLRLTDYLR